MPTSTTTLIEMSTAHRDRILSEAAELVTRSAGAPLSGDNATRFETIETEVDEVNARIAHYVELEQRQAAITLSIGPLLQATDDHQNNPTGAHGLARALVDAKFDLKTNPSVNVDSYKTLGIESRASTFPAATAWGTTNGGIIPMGMDKRFMYPSLVTRDAGNALSIEDYKQTGSRTVTGTVERAIDATTDKATLDIALSLAQEALKQEAIIIPGIPNAILQSIPLMDDFLGGEGRFQIQKAIDAHVLAQIVAATPAFGNTGTTTIDKVRNAIASMRALGADPDLLVLNPTDAAALDLSADAGGYIGARGGFPSTANPANPLWGLRIVERIGGGSDPMYLLDTKMLGILYLGGLQVDANPFGTNFSKNLTDLRFELSCLFHIRNIAGARRIAAT